MANPALLICDEISLGLSPRIIKDLYVVLEAIRAQGTTMIIVEQDITRALRFADRVFCFQEGHVTLQGRPSELTRDEIKRAYFGI
jgi:branched-chain amino acid transport system ATP-binding protein